MGVSAASSGRAARERAMRARVTRRGSARARMAWSGVRLECMMEQRSGGSEQRKRTERKTCRLPRQAVEAVIACERRWRCLNCVCSAQTANGAKDRRFSPLFPSISLLSLDTALPLLRLARKLHNKRESSSFHLDDKSQHLKLPPSLSSSSSSSSSRRTKTSLSTTNRTSNEG
jgi:hypothetical protein